MNSQTYCRWSTLSCFLSSRVCRILGIGSPSSCVPSTFPSSNSFHKWKGRLVGFAIMLPSTLESSIYSRRLKMEHEGHTGKWGKVERGFLLSFPLTEVSARSMCYISEKTQLGKTQSENGRNPGVGWGSQIVAGKSIPQYTTYIASI